jgi:signal transduction histidine kinase
MAREIRNPLGSLHGLVELIQEDFAADDPKRAYTSRILRTIDQLNELVENLLEFSQPPMTHVEPCDVRSPVHEACQTCRFEHSEKLVTFDEDLGDEPIVVRSDAETLCRALLNIIRNAFQASPDGGRVRVRVRREKPLRPGEPGSALIDVANTGSYIEPEVREQLFTPFFTTKPDGTGLGLPIAHQVVTAHSGQIEVTSEPDAETTFTVRLPIGAATVPAAATEDAA